MFYYLSLVDHIDLPPKFFGPQLDEMIFERLKDKVSACTVHMLGAPCVRAWIFVRMGATVRAPMYALGSGKVASALVARTGENK